MLALPATTDQPLLPETVESRDVARLGRNPKVVVVGRTTRRSARSGSLWGLVFGFYVFESAIGYSSVYKTAASRELMAKTFGSNAAISALIGPAHQIQTVAGFAAWRSLGVLSIVGAVWGLLAGTKLLRGEEEAGRWELYLAGRTTPRLAAVQALVGLGIGVLSLWVVTAISTIAVGRSATVHFGVTASLFLAVALVSSAAMFLVVGALSSQMAATRRQAATYAGVALGISFALRMVTDSGIGLAWLAWATPLGWVEELQPLTSPHPAVLIPIVAFIVLLAAVSAYLAGKRDLDASIIHDHDTAEPHMALLSGSGGMAVRLSRGTIIVWVIAVALGSLMLGAMAKSAGDSLSATASAEKILARLGVSGSGALAYLGVSFLITSLLAALVVASLVATMRGEEAGGRLDHLLVRPLSRWSWLAGRSILVIAAVAALAVVAGVASWVAAVPTGVDVSLGSMLGAGVNMAPPSVFLLGLGIFTFGVWPRATTGVVYGMIGWSFLIELIGDVINANHWLLDTSVFHQMATAPAVSPNWTTNCVLVVIGVAAALCGGVAFTHRDLAGT